jgi:hypothetical protein
MMPYQFCMMKVNGGSKHETIAQLEEALFTQINRLSRETMTSLTGYSYILEALHIQVKQ